ncbi:MAG: dihydroorotate dehydrogenase-like protein [Tepidisphaeraceae bacterium]
MNLSINYLGLELSNPIVVGASPLSRNVDVAKQCEAAGAGAIVMYSLFEEQLLAEQRATDRAMRDVADSFAEAVSYFPEQEDFEVGPDEYLELLGKLKRSLSIPVIASLNGTTRGGWLRYAQMMQQAGADAIELNTYGLATETSVPGSAIEDQLVLLVRELKERISIPLTVKLSPFYSSLPHLALRLTDAGAGGLVLFNRFLQPDLDVENLEVVRVNLSDESELLLRLHFAAILFGRVGCDLTVSGGAHSALDIVKAIMAGASTVQMVSALLRNGPQHIARVKADLNRWLVDHEYESVAQMRGSMSLLRCPDPGQYVRQNYMQLLDNWRAASSK